jgi:hypothetical protein
MLDIKTVSDRLSNPDPDAIETLDFEVGMPLLLVDTSGCDMEEDARSEHTTTMTTTTTTTTTTTNDNDQRQRPTTND